MKIIVDRQLNIPADIFPPRTQLIELSAAEITAEVVKDADMLLIGTRTRVNAALLERSRVRFVASATAGADHLDMAWLERQHITWVTGHGANSMACAQYVLCVLAALQADKKLPKRRLKVGVIGVGYVGSLVVRLLQQVGFDVMVNDLPRSLKEPDFISMPLDKWQVLDVICLHVSLDRFLDTSTYHLIDHDFLSRQQPGCVILNASRGAVIDEEAMLVNDHCQYCLDVWENEPNINLNMLARARIATPHIAGYSVEAKHNLNVQVYHAACDFWGWPKKAFGLPETVRSDARIVLTPYSDWQSKALACYDPRLDDCLLRAALQNCINIPEKFNELRKYYTLRHEFRV